MTEVNPLIVGPAGSPDNIRRNERSVADADKFKEEMMRKMGQVQESDADQQKKRKQQAEEEEEEEVIPEPEITPASQVTPFDLQKQVKPMEMGEGGKISPIASAQPTEATSVPKSIFMPASAEAASPEEDFWEEASAQIFSVSSEAQAQPPAPQPQQPPAPEVQPQMPSEPAQQPIYEPSTPPPTEQTRQPTSQAPSFSAQQAQQQQQAQSTQQTQQQQEQQQQQGQSQAKQTDTKKPVAPPAKPGPGEKKPLEEGLEKKPVAMPGEIGKAAASELLQKGISGQEIPETELAAKEETAALFEQLGQPPKEKTGALEKKKEDLAAEKGEGLVSPTPILTPTEGGFEGDHEKKKKEQQQAALGAGELAMPPPQIEISGEVPIAPTPPPPYTSMHSQIFDLFERMVGVMTIMTDSKMTETTITLNSPQFASSVFYGTQIIIQEYASAPKAYNIQLNGNPQAVALFQGNADDLMAAFQHGNYNFRVNRLETGYLSERPLFHRKEKTSGDKQDQQGQEPR